MEGQLREALPVPSTAVFSRTDGVNDWRGCLQRSTPTSENVEAVSSHHGIAYCPAVLEVMASRLAQPEGASAPLSCPTTFQLHHAVPVTGLGGDKHEARPSRTLP
jgi:hypothetical protein